MRLAKNDVTIHGTLLDPDGGRLAGARVRLTALMVPSKFDLNAHLESESHSSFVNSTDHERNLTRPKLLPRRDGRGEALPPAGRPIGSKTAADLFMGNWRGIVTNGDAMAGEHPGGQTNKQGQFRLEQLVPGLRYSAQNYRGMGIFAGMAFESLVLKAGEVKNLGDVRSKPPVDVRGK